MLTKAVEVPPSVMVADTDVGVVVFPSFSDAADELAVGEILTLVVTIVVDSSETVALCTNIGALVVSMLSPSVDPCAMIVGDASGCVTGVLLWADSVIVPSSVRLFVAMVGADVAVGVLVSILVLLGSE